MVVWAGTKQTDTTTNLNEEELMFPQMQGGSPCLDKEPSKKIEHLSALVESTVRECMENKELHFCH